MSEDLGNPAEPLEENEIDANVELAQGVDAIVEGGEISYTIVNVDDLSTLDFTKLLTTSEDTVRKNNDETKAIIKFYGDTPNDVVALNTTVYNIDEIRSVLEQEEWVPADPTSE